MKMHLAKIKIKPSFKANPPKDYKMRKAREEWLHNGNKQTRCLVVNNKGELIDGYVQYLILQENAVKKAEVIRADKPMKCYCRKHFNDKKVAYIYGVHKGGSKKVYVWQVPNLWVKFANKIAVGDMVFCEAKGNVAPVIVTKVEIVNKSLSNKHIGKVVSKTIIKRKAVNDNGRLKTRRAAN